MATGRVSRMACKTRHMNKHKSLGLCMDCSSKPKLGTLRCKKCLKRKNKQNKKWRDKLKQGTGMKKILHLTLKKKWFDMILSGEKKFEYREIKDYWTDRLFNYKGEIRIYDFIRFRNGYRRDSPTIDIEYKALSIKEFEGKNHYALHLGKILTMQNTRGKNNE